MWKDLQWLLYLFCDYAFFEIFKINIGCIGFSYFAIWPQSAFCLYMLFFCTGKLIPWTVTWLFYCLASDCWVQPMEVADRGITEQEGRLGYLFPTPYHVWQHFLFVFSTLHDCSSNQAIPTLRLPFSSAWVWPSFDLQI